MADTSQLVFHFANANGLHTFRKYNGAYYFSAKGPIHHEDDLEKLDAKGPFTLDELLEAMRDFVERPIPQVSVISREKAIELMNKEMDKMSLGDLAQLVSQQVLDCGPPVMVAHNHVGIDEDTLLYVCKSELVNSIETEHRRGLKAEEAWSGIFLQGKPIGTLAKDGKVTRTSNQPV